jgi:chromosome segregation ATPase
MISFATSVAVAIVTAVSAPILVRWWERRDSRRQQTTEMEVAKLSAGDRLMDRLLVRVQELEGRVEHLEQERAENALERAHLVAEYEKVKGLVTDLQEANRQLEEENVSLKGVIVKLNVTISNHMDEIHKLQEKIGDLTRTIGVLRSTAGR